MREESAQHRDIVNREPLPHRSGVVGAKISDQTATEEFSSVRY